MRVQYEDLLKKFQGILESRGFQESMQRTRPPYLQTTAWTAYIPTV